MPWLILSATSFLLATVVVLWAVGRAAQRTEVLIVNQPVQIGTAITADMLSTTQAAFDDGFGRVYTSTQRDIVIGAIAATDLEFGDLLGPAVLNRKPQISVDEQIVGAVLRTGRYPADIRAGDTALAVLIPDDGRTGLESFPVRVLTVSINTTLELSVDLAVPDASAPAVGVWAGTDRLVLVVEPLGTGS
jgi:hypothetical protein